MRVQNSFADNTALASYLDQFENRTFPINQEISEQKISIHPPYLIDSTSLQEPYEVVFVGIDEKYREGPWVSSRVIIIPTNKASERSE